MFPFDEPFHNKAGVFYNGMERAAEGGGVSFRP